MIVEDTEQRIMSGDILERSTEVLGEIPDLVLVGPSIEPKYLVSTEIYFL